MTDRSYYDILGIASSSTCDEIRDAYKTLVSMIHPDRFSPMNQRNQWEKANEMLKAINEAYAVLGDEQRRAEYDKHIQPQQSSASNTRGTRNGSSNSECGAAKEDKTASKTSASPASTAGCITVCFADLPFNDKQALLAYQADKTCRGITKIPTGSLRVPVVAAGVSMVLLCADFWFADATRWNVEQKRNYFVVTLFSSVVLWLSLTAIRKWRCASLKPYSLFTPHHYIETTLDTVRFWPMSSLQSFNCVHHAVNGGYVHTKVKVEFPDATRTIILKSQAAYNSLVHTLDNWFTQTATAARSRNRHTTVVENLLSEYEAAHRRNPVPQSRSMPLDKRKLRSTVLGIAMACAIGTIWCYGAFQANDYYDDARAWGDAHALNTASSYRKYLDYRVDGCFRTTATQRLSDLYSAARQHYTDTRAGKFDNSASAAILELLNYAKSTGHYGVRIVFQRQNDIPDGVEAQLAASWGKTNVLPIGTSFSEERMTSREDSILESVKSAFGKIMAEDILTFQRSGYEETDSVFVISYVVSAGRSLYFRESDDGVEARSRPYYPGIQFTWNFQIKIPSSQDTAYHFDLHSWPATHIAYTNTTQTPEASLETTTVYDAMAQSAFDNFRDVVVNRFGLGNASSSTRTGIDADKQQHLSKEYDDLTREVANADKTISELSNALDANRSKIKQQKTALDAEHTAVDLTNSDAVNAFNDKVRQYNESREIFNELVNRHNSALQKQRQRASRLQEVENALKPPEN